MLGAVEETEKDPVLMHLPVTREKEDVWPNYQKWNPLRRQKWAWGISRERGDGSAEELKGGFVEEVAPEPDEGFDG